MRKRSVLVAALASLALIGSLGLSSCAEDKAKPGTAVKGGQDCSACEQQKAKLAQQLKKTKAQVSKLKKALQAAKKK